MAKKKKKEQFKKEQTLEQRRKVFRETTIGEAIILGSLTLYGMFMIMAILDTYPKANILTAVQYLVPVIMDNPIYFVAVWMKYPDSLMKGLGAGVVALFLAELLVMINYYFNRDRIHSNLDTLKGSTVWGNPKEITAKYAEFDDE